jgi:hypothetical protein
VTTGCTRSSDGADVDARCWNLAAVPAPQSRFLLTAECRFWALRRTCSVGRGGQLSRVDQNCLRRSSTGACDPLYGPAVWCKRFSSIRQIRSCINVSGLCLERGVLRAIMDISAHAISLAERPRTGPLGSPVFACAGKTDPPSSSSFRLSAGIARRRHKPAELPLHKLSKSDGCAVL